MQTTPRHSPLPTSLLHAPDRVISMRQCISNEGRWKQDWWTSHMSHRMTMRQTDSRSHSIGLNSRDSESCCGWTLTTSCCKRINESCYECIDDQITPSNTTDRRCKRDAFFFLIFPKRFFFLVLSIVAIVANRAHQTCR